MNQPFPNSLTQIIKKALYKKAQETETEAIEKLRIAEKELKDEVDRLRAQYKKDHESFLNASQEKEYLDSESNGVRKAKDLLERFYTSIPYRVGKMITNPWFYGPVGGAVLGATAGAGLGVYKRQDRKQVLKKAVIGLLLGGGLGAAGASVLKNYKIASSLDDYIGRIQKLSETKALLEKAIKDQNIELNKMLRNNAYHKEIIERNQTKIEQQVDEFPAIAYNVGYILTNPWFYGPVGGAVLGATAGTGLGVYKNQDRKQVLKKAVIGLLFGGGLGAAGAAFNILPKLNAMRLTGFWDF